SPTGCKPKASCSSAARKPAASCAIRSLRSRSWSNFFQVRSKQKNHARPPNPQKQPSRNGLIPNGSRRCEKSIGGRTGFKTDTPSPPRHTDDGKTFRVLLWNRKYTENAARERSLHT